MTYVLPLRDRIAAVIKMANDEEGSGYRWLSQYERTWYVVLHGTLHKLFLNQLINFFFFFALYLTISLLSFKHRLQNCTVYAKTV